MAGNAAILAQTVHLLMCFRLRIDLCDAARTADDVQVWLDQRHAKSSDLFHPWCRSADDQRFVPVTSKVSQIHRPAAPQVISQQSMQGYRVKAHLDIDY